MEHQIEFTRLPEIDPTEIIAHMSDPRIAEHMPLLTSGWNETTVANFVTAKEECWSRDGLGHWAILSNNKYVGWGGFQREGDEWDFGLVLKPDSFGLGACILRKAINFAISNERIPFVSFLLPPSRRNLGALIALTFVDYFDVNNRKAFRFEQLSQETISFVEEVERISGRPVSLLSTDFNWRNVIDRRAW